MKNVAEGFMAISPFCLRYIIVNSCFPRRNFLQVSLPEGHLRKRYAEKMVARPHCFVDILQQVTGYSGTGEIRNSKIYLTKFARGRYYV
jgi:hypothetical protein